MIRMWRRTRKRIMMMLDADADDGCDAFGLCFRFCFSFVRSSFCLVLAALFSSSFIHSFIPFHFSPFHSILFHCCICFYFSLSLSFILCLLVPATVPLCIPVFPRSAYPSVFVFVCVCVLPPTWRQLSDKDVARESCRLGKARTKPPRPVLCCRC